MRATGTTDQLPHDQQAECVVVASLVYDRDAWGRIESSGLVALDFFDPRLRVCFSTLCQLHRDQQPVSFAVLCTELGDKRLAKLGGESALDRLVRGVEGLGTVAAGYYAAIVKRCALQRAYIASSAKIAQAAYAHDGTPAELQERMASIWRASLPVLDGSDGRPKEYLTFADLDQILSEIRWAWPGYLPRGFLTIVAGAQEAGKSFLLLRFAATFIAGWPWPDGTPYEGPTGSVVWAEGEAGQAINLARANAWGLDLSKIILPTEEIEDFTLANPDHLPRLRDLLMRDTVLFAAIDSLSGIHQRKESDAEMNAVIKGFAELARDSDKCLGLSHHLLKAPRIGYEIELRDVRGSGTITQTARTVIGLDRPDPHWSERRRIRVLKSTLGLPGKALGMSIVSPNGDLEFDGAVPKVPKKDSQMDRAKDLLLTVLKKEALPSGQVQRSFQEAGISWRTAKQAKKALGIIAMRDGTRWYWGLPSVQSKGAM